MNAVWACLRVCGVDAGGMVLMNSVSVIVDSDDVVEGSVP